MGGAEEEVEVEEEEAGLDCLFWDPPSSRSRVLHDPSIFEQSKGEVKMFLQNGFLQNLTRMSEEEPLSSLLLLWQAA